MTRVPIEQRLAAYLALAARSPFGWGDFDCGVGFVAGWVRQERGVDPGQGLRGTYASPLGAARMIRAAGGLPALASRQFAACGVQPTEDPQAGDVAVVWTQGSRRLVQTMALRTPRRWAFLAPNGIAIGGAILIQAWRL